MSKNPCFSFYVNDFEGGTRHMTDAEVGCYLRLLMAQFNRGGELPEDKKYLARFCTTFEQSWPIVEEKFVQCGEGKICNQRLNNEILKKQKHLKKQSENGSKGGRPPKTETEPKIKPNQNPIEIQDEGKHKARDNPDHDPTKAKNNTWLPNGLENKNPLGNGYGNGKGNGYSEGIAKGSMFGAPLGPSMVDIFRSVFPNYPIDQDLDFRACTEIAKKIAVWKGWPESEIVDSKLGDTLAIWQKLVSFAKADDWFSSRSISDLSKEFQRLIQKYGTEKRTQSNRGNARSGATNGYDPTKIEREGFGTF